MNKQYHLIGIGGIGMSGIARLLLRCGARVSGSDLRETGIINELKALGAKVFLGHNAANIAGADVVIYSSAIKADNPEMRQARKNGICLIQRAQALAGLMKDKTVITVTGSHGKTTTTSLASYLLMEAGLMPTVAIGGILRNIDTNACIGEGAFFVAEADESDGSFLYYQPKYSIITNIDYEHLDYYKEFKNLLEAFRQFINKTAQDGCLFCCNEDNFLRDILRDYKNKYLLFGLGPGADIYPKNITLRGLTSEFDCFYQNKFVSRFNLSLAGLHNISNALAVIALGLQLGVDVQVIRNTLAGYKGAGRRMEIKFQDKDYTLIDDYAHHPTEIKATLAAARNLQAGRVIAVFQPHRYSRTKLLLDEFARSFDLADSLFITDIYPASEPPIEGINGRSICERIKVFSAGKQVEFLAKEEIVPRILATKRAGDLIITLGAGDITKISDELAERLKSQKDF